MSEKTVNTFHEGMNLDISDFVIKKGMARFNQNVRLINLGGSSYVITNLQGNDLSFQLSNGFRPVSTQEHRNVLYIISWNQATAQLEIGSYPSPDPVLGGTNFNVYRPFNNLIGGPTVNGVTNAFRLLMSDLQLPNTFPIIQKMELQSDYDRSTNVLFTVRDGTRNYKPRIVNCRFSSELGPSGLRLEYTPLREGTANTNEYTLSSVDKETTTIIYSPKILKIEYGQISPGGKLKPGNYVYVFQYMTEDFNKTNVIGQSSICQVAFGQTNLYRKGGDETQETDLRVVLKLSNLDTDFKFLKAYAFYSSGQLGIVQQYLEFTNPIAITGESMDFIHNGYEELAEVSQDTVNVDHVIVDGADASTQVGGYYMLGGIRQRSYNFKIFKEGTIQAKLDFFEKPLTLNPLPGYADPENVYKYMGNFGREAYPYGIVYIMPDGSLSPVFPCKGVDFDSTSYGVLGRVDEAAPTPTTWYKGIVRMPWTNHYPTFDQASNTIRVKGLKIDVSTIPTTIKGESIGFFVVRAERNTDLIGQGLIVPTFKAPTREAHQNSYNPDQSNQSGYYTDYGAQIDDPFRFKRLPIVDNLLETYAADHEDSGFSFSTADGNGNIVGNNSHGFAPTYLQNQKEITPARPEIFLQGTETWLRHYALLFGDAFANEAYYINQLQRDNVGIHQLDRVDFVVGGNISPLTTHFFNPPKICGMLYEFSKFRKAYPGKILKTANNIVYVQGETFAPSGKFISKIRTSMFYRTYNPDGLFDGTASEHVLINQAYNPYFGIEMTEGVNGQLNDSGRGADNPLAGVVAPNIRPGYTVNAGGETGAPLVGVCRYANLGNTVQAGFLINIYRSATTSLSGVTGINNLYPIVDNLVYRQVTSRMSWADAAAQSNVIEVFGGDCYISKVYRKMWQSGERNPQAGIGVNESERFNVDMGLAISWYQESKYNLHLRQPKRFDTSELEDRSFFPYQSKGDFPAYRKYRYPETIEHSQGYSELERPKTHAASPGLAPYIENYFFSRIVHSERHIPNAFRNGYRVFLESSFRDYDSSMGRIIGMFNHRGRLLIVFEQGIGITEVEQRIQTGADAAGAIFVEPSDVLPPNIQYVSREIGCQDHLSFVQTPGAVYGVDRAKDKIWKFSDSLKVISDDAVSSYLIANPISRPRSGYDFENNEVIFTTDNWTLCFREGLEKFTSFYTFPAQYYSRLNKQFFSFLDNQSWKHNQPNYMIYGEEKDVIVEFVINENLSMAKVVDYLNVISNEVPPAKVEFYSYNQEVDIGATISVAALNQYGKVENIVDPVTEANPIFYRDKKFIVQTPVRSDYEPGTPQDEWAIEGRIRDKYIIVRLTYRTDSPLELASVISTFRYSMS